MKTYIENLGTELRTTKDGNRQFEILQLLNEEKNHCQDLIISYNERISKLGECAKSQEIIDHETEILHKILEITNTI